MLITKFFSFEDFTMNTSVFQRKGEYITKFYQLGGEHSDFHNLLCGTSWEEDKFPPFRDAESEELIRKCNNSELVEGEWYAMITPYGKTCLEACCGSVRYGLTVIDNSRKGIYTEIGSAGDNVWEYLAKLDMDIYIGVHSTTGYHVPASVPVVVRDYEKNGVIQDVLYLGDTAINSIPQKYQKLSILEPLEYFELVHIKFGSYEYREKGKRIWAVGLDTAVEYGSLEYVLSELCASGLYYNYSLGGEKDHAHTLEGVLKALVRDPTEFSVAGFEEQYSKQELQFINKIQAILIEEKSD